MTYNVFSGTLNPTHSLTHSRLDSEREDYQNSSMLYCMPQL